MIDDIVKLDQINMAAVIAQSGGIFSPERRKKALENESSNGSIIICQYQGDDLQGYLQYTAREQGVYYIVSIQVHPDCRSGHTLRKLLTKTALDFLSRKPTSLISSVHTHNKESISLHQRLGFREEACIDQRIQFSLSGQTLNHKLRQLAKTKWSRPV